MMIDPDDVKPEGWDDIPTEIPDPKAVRPGMYVHNICMRNEFSCS